MINHLPSARSMKEHCRLTMNGAIQQTHCPEQHSVRLKANGNLRQESLMRDPAWQKRLGPALRPGNSSMTLPIVAVLRSTKSALTSGFRLEMKAAPQ
eukprot:2817695-Rhodomonas_salina.1